MNFGVKEKPIYDLLKELKMPEKQETNRKRAERTMNFDVKEKPFLELLKEFRNG